MIDLKAMRKADKRTLVLPLKLPSAEFPQLFQPPQMQIVKNGATNFKSPIGTGPFKYVSFRPGQNSVFKRNDALLERRPSLRGRARHPLDPRSADAAQRAADGPGGRSRVRAVSAGRSSR